MASKQLDTVHEHESKIIVDRVISLGDMTKLDLPVKSGKAMSGKTLDDWLDKKETEAACNVIERGIGYLLKKRELGHGQFQAWIIDHGHSPRSVQETMKAAELLVNLSDSNARRAAHLPSRKITVLSAAPASLIDDLFDSGALDDVQELNREQLREIVRLQKEVAKGRLNLEKEKDRVRLLQKKRNTPEGFSYPPTIERVRIESSVMASHAYSCLDDMEQFAVELMQASDLSSNKEKQQAEFSAGASTLYLNLKAIHTKASYLLGWFAESIGEDYLPDKIEDIPVMDEAEAQRIHSMYELMLAEGRLQKESRESARKANRKKKKA